MCLHTMTLTSQPMCTWTQPCQIKLFILTPVFPFNNNFGLLLLLLCFQHFRLLVLFFGYLRKNVQTAKVRTHNDDRLITFKCHTQLFSKNTHMYLFNCNDQNENNYNEESNRIIHTHTHLVSHWVAYEVVIIKKFVTYHNRPKTVIEYVWVCVH